MSEMSAKLSAEADQVAQAIEDAMVAVRHADPTDLDALKTRSDNLCHVAIAEANESDDTVRMAIIAKLETIVGRMNVLEDLLRTRDDLGHPS